MDLLRRAAMIIFAFMVLGSLAVPAAVVEAGDTLARIKSRGKLRCGVSDGIQGFSLKNADGQWSGMDVDFCRAVAAGVLGDPAKVEFIPLTAAARFPALKGGELDVLVRNTTWTLEREAVLGILFAGVLYYDGQGFMVPASSGVNELHQLKGATICVVKGTTHEAHLTATFTQRSMTWQPLPVDSQEQAAEALFAGKCQAFSSERPQLTAIQMRAPGGPKDYRILPEQISKEPMGPAVKRGDEEWFTIVRWVLFTLIRAEESDYTQGNVRARLEQPHDFRSQAWKDLDGLIAKSLGIAPGWAIRIVESVGNYGQIFERNVGGQSALKLERGLNRLWTEGGLMYAPPFR
jgi:general L-amino acid transport system substrate-binding protein